MQIGKGTYTSSGGSSNSSAAAYGLTGKQISQGITNVTQSNNQQPSQPKQIGKGAYIQSSQSSSTNQSSPTPSTSFQPNSTGGVGTPAPIPVRTASSPSSSGGLPTQLNTGYPGLYVVSNNAPFAQGGIGPMNQAVPQATPVYALTPQGQKVQLTTGEGYSQAGGGYKFVTPDSPNYGRVNQELSGIQATQQIGKGAYRQPTNSLMQTTYSGSQPNPNSMFDAPLVTNRPQTVRQQQVNNVFNSVQAGAAAVDRGAPSSNMFAAPGAFTAPKASESGLNPFSGGLFGSKSSAQPQTQKNQATPTNNVANQYTEIKTVQSTPSTFGKVVDFFNPFGSSRKELVQKDIARINQKQEELMKRGTILAGVEKGLLDIPKFAETHPKTFLATGLALATLPIAAPLILPVTASAVTTTELVGLGIYNVGKQSSASIPIFKSGTTAQKNIAKGELVTTIALAALPFVGEIPQVVRNVVKKETIPIEKITTPEVISGQKDFVNVGQTGIKASTPQELINVFKGSKYAKNIGETKGGFSASPNPISGSVEVVQGKYVNVPGLAKQRDVLSTTTIKSGEPKAGELPGVFVAPAASTYFLKTSNQDVSFSLFPKVNSPTIQFLRAREILPITKETTRQPGNLYLTPGVTNFLSKSKIPGKYGDVIRKSEAEGQYTPGTEYKFVKLAGNTKVGKDIVPVKIYELTESQPTIVGKTKAAVSRYNFKNEFESSSSSSRNNIALSSLITGSASLSSASSLGSLPKSISSLQSSKGSSIRSSGSSGSSSFGSSGLGSSIGSSGTSFGSSAIGSSIGSNFSYGGLGSSRNSGFGNGGIGGQSPEKGPQPFLSKPRGSRYTGSVLAGITGLKVKRTPGNQLTGLEERPFVVPGTHRRKGERRQKQVNFANMPKIKLKMR